jgi:NitT/TauT family transport system substrate-binding protein
VNPPGLLLRIAGPQARPYFRERTGPHTPPATLAAGLAQLTFTNDPLASSLISRARQASTLGIPQAPINLTSIFQLAPLNLLLRETGQPPAVP